jgi:hypothetical protein
MSYVGVIIEESLLDARVLRAVHVRRTVVHPVTEWHRTPWVQQWTLQVVEIADDLAEQVATILSQTIDASRGAWYADFKNDTRHYVVFPNRIFCIDRAAPQAYAEAKAFGRAFGIPEHQLDFDSADVESL